MAKWRAEALKRLPEHQRVIEAAPSIMSLWIELSPLFHRAYEVEPRDESLIARIYGFADWCMQAPRHDDAGHDPLSAVACAFYEHIPTHGPARDDMPRWFRPDEVARSREVFAYLIGDEKFEKLLAYMKQHRDRYVKRRPGATA